MAPVTRRTRAFTLIELLVVVGIIAVLVSILLPMVGSMRSRSRGVNCASNERQIFLALVAFAADHDGYLPIPALVFDGASGEGKNTAWAIDDQYTNTGGVIDFKVGTLWPYMADSAAERQRDVLCPTDSGEPSHHNGMQYLRNFSYAFNANIGHPGSGITSMQLNQVRLPASKILIYEENAPNDEWGLGGTNYDDWPSGRHGTSRANVTSGGPSNQLWMVEGLGNYCFFDGHIALLSPQTIYNDVQHTPSMYTPLK